jgi:DNA-binding response OmpR family regulator
MTDDESGTARQVASRLAQPDGGGQTMEAARPLRVLFVGRRATAEALEAVVAGLARDRLAENGAWPSTAGAIDLVTLTNQRTALEEMRAQPPKIVLVEIEAKRQSRVRFIEMVRYRLPTAVIFAVSAQPLPGREGFDGVLQLPLHEQEVRAAIRRAVDELAGHVMERGPIRLNVATRTVVTPNGQRHMTPKQCSLLQFFLAHVNQVVSRKDIMEKVWETDYLEDTRTLDVHIRWLRECIEPDPSNPIYLLTARGKGYHLRLPQEK